MKNVLKWVGIALGSLVGLFLLAALAIFIYGSSRLNKTYAFSGDQIRLPADAAGLERGKHLATVLCTGCHGADLGGVDNWVIVDGIGTIDSANLTAGVGGIGREFQSVSDYVNAIRHGVDPEGKTVYMPAVAATSQLSDDDLGAVIAYLKTLPPVDHPTKGHHFTLLGTILVGAGAFGKLPVEAAPHTTQISAPPAGISVEYGAYMAAISDCRTCHGQNLAGGKSPDPNETMLAPNLTPGGELLTWTEADFLKTIQTGVKPGGAVLTDSMPWKEYNKLSEDELKAIFMYLKTLPKRPTEKP